MQRNHAAFTHNPANTPRLIALDLDGTLLKSDQTISPRAISVIQRCAAQGMLPVIATARPPRSVKRFLPDGFPPGPWIVYSGAEIYNDKSRILQNAIAPEVAKETIEFLKAAAPNAIISVELDNRLFANRPLEGPWEHEIASNLVDVIDRPVAKILIELSQVQDPKFLKNGLPCGCKIALFDENEQKFADIVAPEVSKVWALGELLKMRGFSFADVIAFGDSEIDVGMIAKSGLGIAMGNATPAVKQVADWIAPSNDEDGVADTLEQLLASIDSACSR